MPRTSIAVRIAVLSDDRLFSDGLGKIVSADEGFTVAGTSGCDNLQSVLLLRPHILIIDGNLPDAITLCAKATSTGRRGANGEPTVVFVAAPDDDDWAIEALGAGARGILGKRAGPGDLLKAIRAVREGQVWTSRRVLAAWLARLTAPAPFAAPGAVSHQLYALLSQREREVFQHAATGKGNKELAVALAVSEATIKVHLTRIFQKLGLRGRAELAAAYHGLLPQHNRDGSRARLSRLA